ncbi:MAG: hypothetical protein RIQ41_243 [Candidatus Parcubacteria bacterium]|jgi:hypothetical protein
MESTQSNDDSLLALVAEAKSYLHPNTNCFPRSIAGEILQHVGRHGDYGGVAKWVSPFMIGIAVQRLVRNYTKGDEWKIQFLKGLFFNPHATITAELDVHVTPEDRDLA